MKLSNGCGWFLAFSSLAPPTPPPKVVCTSESNLCVQLSQKSLCTSESVLYAQVSRLPTDMYERIY